MLKSYIGRHIGTTAGIRTVVDHGFSIGCNFIQIFLSSPRKYNFNRRKEEDLLYVKEKLIEKNIKLVIHANYMLNFCNPVDSNKHKSAVKILTNDLKDSVVVGAIGVIVHMGKKLKMNEKIAFNNYVKGIKTVLEQTPDSSTIILETGAGQGTEICTSIIDLGKLYRSFTDDEKKRIKFCIDTCHIFASGYNIGDVNYIDMFSKLVDDNLSWSNVSCIHLNDSLCQLKSRKDRHANLGLGCINVEGLRKFVRVCADKNIPIVLETPCLPLDKFDEINIVRNWLK